MARGGHRVIPDLEGDTPPIDKEGRSPFQKTARGVGDDFGHARGKRRQLKDQGAGNASRAPRSANSSPEPTPTDWGSATLLPRHYSRHPAWSTKERSGAGRQQRWRS